MTNETECPICLEPILTNKLEECIILDCCNKQVHLSCLIDWCKSQKHINKNVCVLCRQDTIFLRDFNNNIQLQDTIVDVPLERTTTNIRDIDIAYTNLTHSNQSHDICCLTCLLSIICSSIFYIIIIH